MNSKKRIHWSNFFIYMIVSFPLMIGLFWFMSVFNSLIDIPVLLPAAVISIGMSLWFSYQTDEEYHAELKEAERAAQYSQAHPKDKSVIGSAVVGSIIAGPLGGVVGAIHAADKNAKKRAENGK